MLKFREGKIMLINMLLIFAATAACAFLAPEYYRGGYYKFLLWFFAVDIVILALGQIYLSWKLYRIANEISQVSSKTGVVDESNSEAL